jgi:hypothetical protein
LSSSWSLALSSSWATSWRWASGGMHGGPFKRRRRRIAPRLAYIASLRVSDACTPATQHTEDAVPHAETVAVTVRVTVTVVTLQAGGVVVVAVLVLVVVLVGVGVLVGVLVGVVVDTDLQCRRGAAIVTGAVQCNAMRRGPMRCMAYPTDVLAGVTVTVVVVPSFRTRRYVASGGPTRYCGPNCPLYALRYASAAWAAGRASISDRALFHFCCTAANGAHTAGRCSVPVVTPMLTVPLMTEPVPSGLTTRTSVHWE